jgi:hypothetical protein
VTGFGKNARELRGIGEGGRGLTSLTSSIRVFLLTGSAVRLVQAMRRTLEVRAHLHC